MYKTKFLRALTAALSLVLFFSSCHQTDEPPYSSDAESSLENPFPLETPTEPSPLPEPPTENAPPAIDPLFWDYSDVDVSTIDPARKLISFTFDDSPSKTLENILAVYASYNESNPDCPASATLFCNGRLCNASSMHKLRTAYAMGWELGNHTYSHFDLTSISPQQVRSEIDSTETLLREIDNKTEHLFRAPFGRIDEEVKSVISVPIINWTIDTLDWSGTTADEMYEQVLAQKFPGAIVLMHDGYESTVDALKKLLPALKDEGYQVVSVSAMAKMHECPLKRGGVYIRARKNGIG